MNKKFGNNLFLISFLPAILYWYLDEYYPVRIALIGGISLSVIEIIFEKIFTKHVHTLSKFNFFLIVFLGGLSLLGDDGIWFKMQPAFSFWGISVFLIYRQKKGRGLFLEMMEGMNAANKSPPPFILKAMEVHITYLFLFYGSLMAVLAFWFSTAVWVFFKTAGLYIFFALFMVFEFILNKKRMIKFQSSTEGEIKR